MPTMIHDNMNNLIKQKFGKNTSEAGKALPINLVYGDWGVTKQMRNFISTPNLGVKRKLIYFDVQRSSKSVFLAFLLPFKGLLNSLESPSVSGGPSLVSITFRASVQDGHLLTQYFHLGKKFSVLPFGSTGQLNISTCPLEF